MHNALWNPNLFVLDTAQEREISLGFNGYIVEFHCLFIHMVFRNGIGLVPTTRVECIPDLQPLPPKQPSAKEHRHDGHQKGHAEHDKKV